MFLDLIRNPAFSCELSKASNLIELNRIDSESINLGIDSSPVSTHFGAIYRETKEAIKETEAFVLCIRNFSARRVWLLHP